MDLAALTSLIMGTITPLVPLIGTTVATKLSEAEDFVANLMKEATGGQSLRDKLRKFAKAQGIPV